MMARKTLERPRPPRWLASMRRVLRLVAMAAETRGSERSPATRSPTEISTLELIIISVTTGIVAWDRLKRAWNRVTP
jgi:hypothetical protein